MQQMKAMFASLLQMQQQAKAAAQAQKQLPKAQLAANQAALLLATAEAVLDAMTTLQQQQQLPKPK